VVERAGRQSVVRRLARPLRRRARRVRTRLVDLYRRVGSAVLPYRPMQGGRDLLDSEYRSGDWDYLASDQELPRFAVVAAYCLRFGEGRRILEIGCGEGLLPDRIGPGRYAEFVGLDISEAAIERASAREHENATFVAADAATFVPETSFDVIVFHEVLEYFEDPIGLVRRYDRWLADDGVLVVSQYDAPDTVRTRRIWRGLEIHYRHELEARVITAPRMRWIVRVLRPAGTG
jgi:SAM-dependent methyltransferase